MHQLVQHHALITQQLQLMRVPLTDEEHATLIAIENLGLEPSSDDLWCFVIQGVPHVSGAQLLWRDASGQAHYPSRSAYTVQRIRGRSQRRHTLSAPAEPLDELYLEISVEHDGSGTTTP